MDNHSALKHYGEAVMNFDNLPERGKEILFEFVDRNLKVTQHKETLFDIIDVYCDDCKSPIEQIFKLAYELVTFSKVMDGGHIYDIYPQQEIVANNNRYYADFLFDTSYCDDGKGTFDKCNKIKVVIECDGHSYHKLTKEQVARDNRRDYDLKCEGYEVLHFSGSEIYNNPFDCARRTYEFIDKKLGIKGRGRSNGRTKNVHKKSN